MVRIKDVPPCFVRTLPLFWPTRDFKRKSFGAASLVVSCPDIETVRGILEVLEGQLTVASHLDNSDLALAQDLMPVLERRAGRVIANGFGTGVEVGHAMVHGGPFPSTADGRSTSVGSMAIERFLRPVSYQDLPQSLLPESLQDTNPFALNRRIDGKLSVKSEV